ncbi:hypothetical protein [Variovorax paradoxus]|uniref:hypothetical protein n=1 Tax=Variovorax paradoxus TaxID=34073 RepID=UPI002481496D|nr:hypothetical protein [Variovorax paradoxus]WGT62417.1 hypothetical protein QHG62_20475 [Variovorax paradoxus]
MKKSRLAHLASSFSAQGLASTHRPSARHYISGVSATTPIPFDLARFIEGLIRRLDGMRPSAARAASRTQHAHRGSGGAAMDQRARDLQALVPRTARFSAVRLRGVRHFRRSGTAPDRLAQAVRDGGRKAGRPRGSSVLAAVDAGPVGRHDARARPAKAGTGAPAGENATGSARDVIRVDGVAS